MSGYSSMEDDDLRARLECLLKRLDVQLKHVAPIVRNIAEDRLEASIIIDELKRRGIEIDPGKDATPSSI